MLIGGGVHDSVVGGLFTVDPEQYWSKVYGSTADLHWSVRFVAEASELLIAEAKEAYRTGNYAPLGHAALEVVGLVPVVGVPADAANGVWYATEGNWTDATFSVGAAIPGFGYAFNAAKYGNQAGKLYKLTKAVDIGVKLGESGYFVQQGIANGSALQVGMGVFGFWTDWQDVSETYGRIDGFAKVFSVDPASIDLSALPDGYGIQFRYRTMDMAAVMDSIVIESTAILQSLGDTNNDGVVDTLDIDPFVLLLTDPAGYATAFPGVDALAVGDINSDTVVDTLDIDPFVALLTTGSLTGGAVPEPTAMALLSLAGLGLWGLRKVRN